MDRFSANPKRAFHGRRSHLVASRHRNADRKIRFKRFRSSLSVVTYHRVNTKLEIKTILERLIPTCCCVPDTVRRGRLFYPLYVLMIVLRVDTHKRIMKGCSNLSKTEKDGRDEHTLLQFFVDRHFSGLRWIQPEQRAPSIANGSDASFL